MKFQYKTKNGITGIITANTKSDAEKALKETVFIKEVKINFEKIEKSTKTKSTTSTNQKLWSLVFDNYFSLCREHSENIGTISQKLNIPITTVKKYVRGETMPSRKTIYKFLEIFKIDEFIVNRSRTKEIDK